jgi:hypothetical protein
VISTSVVWAVTAILRRMVAQTVKRDFMIEILTGGWNGGRDAWLSAGADAGVTGLTYQVCSRVWAMNCSIWSR